MAAGGLIVLLSKIGRLKEDNVPQDGEADVYKKVGATTGDHPHSDWRD